MSKPVYWTLWYGCCIRYLFIFQRPIWLPIKNHLSHKWTCFFVRNQHTVKEYESQSPQTWDIVAVWGMPSIFKGPFDSRPTNFWVSDWTFIKWQKLRVSVLSSKILLLYAACNLFWNVHCLAEQQTFEPDNRPTLSLRNQHTVTETESQWPQIWDIVAVSGVHSNFNRPLDSRPTDFRASEWTIVL